MFKWTCLRCKIILFQALIGCYSFSIVVRLGLQTVAVDSSRVYPEPPLVVAPPNNNTTLVIVLGNLRGGETAWDSLYRHVLDVNSADLALVIGRQDRHESSMYERAKYLYEFPEYDEWADAVDLIDGPSWRTTILPYNTNESGLFGPVFHRPGSAVINYMARWFAQNMIVDHNLTQTYSRFVVTRSDHYYCGPHILEDLDNNFVWVPKGEGYFRGICDRHVVANSSLILNVLDLLPHLLKHPHIYRRHDSKFHDATPERFVTIVWYHNGIWPFVKLFDRMMFLVQRMGIDSTRGTTGDPSIANGTIGQFGLAAKYNNEYEASMCRCRDNGTYVYMKDRVRGTCRPSERA